MSHPERDRDPTRIVAQRPVLHLLGDEVGVRNKNTCSFGSLHFGRTHADLANIPLLASDHDQITDLDGSLCQEDQPRYKVVDYALQAETDADRERAGQYGQIGEIEARVRKGGKRCNYDADIADADPNGVTQAARNTRRLEHPLVEPPLKQPRRRISQPEHDYRSEHDRNRHLHASNAEAEEKLGVPVVDVRPPVTPLQ